MRSPPTGSPLTARPSAVPPQQQQQQPVRPKGWWIAVAWGFFVVCVIAGVVLFGTGLTGGLGDAAPSRSFAPGETVTLTLDPADKPAIYLTRGTQVNWECRIDGNAKLVKATGGQTVQINGPQWELIALVNAPAKGDYKVTCTIDEQADTRFGLGRDLTIVAGGVLGGAAALIIVPSAGFVVAVIWTIVIVVRRNNHRRRLTTAG